MGNNQLLAAKHKLCSVQWLLNNRVRRQVDYNKVQIDRNYAKSIFCTKSYMEAPKTNDTIHRPPPLNCRKYTFCLFLVYSLHTHTQTYELAYTYSNRTIGVRWTNCQLLYAQTNGKKCHYAAIYFVEIIGEYISGRHTVHYQVACWKTQKFSAIYDLLIKSITYYKDDSILCIMQLQIIGLLNLDNLIRSIYVILHY